MCLFDTYVSCVLNYTCEVWGLYKSVAIEKVYLEYLKRISKVKQSTPNMMVYSELGRMSMIIKRKTRIIKYWIKLLHTNNSILQHIYKDNLDRISCDNANMQSSWLYGVKNLLLSLGFGDV